MNDTTASRKGQQYRTIRKRITSIKPSPENAALYRPTTPDDQDIEQMAESIQRRGLQEPLILTKDGFIVSGHRRYEALKLLAQKFIPCRVLSERRADMSRDEYVALLREHNLQRRKSVVEQMREELVDLDPTKAHATLRDRREKLLHGADTNGVDILKIEGQKRRHVISTQKADHVKYVKKVVFEDRRDYWPLSVRGIHYGLLNYRFLRNIPRKLQYINDETSYHKTSELLTRMRLLGVIPWESLDDFTRPIKLYRPYDDVQAFVHRHMEHLLAGYWRNLMQSQTCHVEVLCEKNTVYHMVCRATKKYQIPTASGRGFNSIDPWHDLVARYIKSGKERLVVIVVSDYDPEGEEIPHVGGRTLRGDFGLQPSEFDIIKAGVTREQIERYGLPPQNFVKEESVLRPRFLARNGGNSNVYELEALEPKAMIRDLEKVIRGVIDLDAYNAEVEREKAEAVYLERVRARAQAALRDALAADE